VFTALAPSTFERPGYPANGLVIESDDHALLVDTGWNDAQSEALRAFAASRGRPLSAAVATHFHDDRVGGASALEAAGVPVYATEDTIARARAEGNATPDHALTEGALPEIAWLFPGAAHAPDNVVVFHAPSGTLYGGCMIKELAATSLGNVTDADLTAWPAAIEAVRTAFPAAVRVVPGHGAIGDASLLAHTASLLGVDECGRDDDCVVSLEPLEPCACCGCVAPRALTVTRAARGAQMAQMSCEPVCDDAVCAPCAEQRALLSTLHAVCDDRVCFARSSP
jgi:glyoxylase-like metal-dependent hydrolase (beta-lactamase superfamily II)